MVVRVGTFNLNNLFSRFNFRGEIEALNQGDADVSETYTFGDPTSYELRTFQGMLVRAKDPEETALIAKRIIAMDADVLAVQEVENVETLRSFNIEHLDGRYPNSILVEGNDPRLIDVAVLTKDHLPLGAITTWQATVHPSDPEIRVFSRDLLEVEVLNEARTERLFTLFNTHLKSHYVPWDQDQEQGAAEADAKRLRQAESIGDIVRPHLDEGGRFVVAGDMNDPPDSAALEPMTDELDLVNALAEATETIAAKADVPPPSSAVWTHRFKESGEPAHYELLDHLWLSPELAPSLSNAMIGRRTKHSGDGSDHDPAWIDLEITS